MAYNIINLLKSKSFAEPAKISFEDVFFNRKNILTTFLNSYSYSKARKDYDLFRQLDYILYDGTFIVIFINIFLRKSVRRRSFDMTSLAPKLFKHCTKENRSVFLIGAKQTAIEKAVVHLETAYPGINIVGFRGGYFESKQSRSNTIEKIVNLSPDFLIVGMGTPLQEQFLVEVKNNGWNGIGFTCGGFLHQTSNSLHYYPKTINKLHLRWLFRLYDEPKLILRFIKSYSIFPFFFIKDYIKHKK